MKSYGVTIQMKATEQYFPVVLFIMLYNVVLTFESVDEILWCDHSTYVQKCMQWRKWQNWRKIASCWRFELDAKSGPLEAGDFGEIADFGKNRHACNGENGKTGEISELDAKSGPLEAGDFGENGDFGEIGDFGKNRQRAGDMRQNIQIGCQKWPLQSR